jgi:hypothetical protein
MRATQKDGRICLLAEVCRSSSMVSNACCLSRGRLCRCEVATLCPSSSLSFIEKQLSPITAVILAPSPPITQILRAPPPGALRPPGPPPLSLSRLSLSRDGVPPSFVVVLQPRGPSRRGRRHGRPSGGPRRRAFRPGRATPAQNTNKAYDPKQQEWRVSN